MGFSLIKVEQVHIYLFTKNIKCSLEGEMFLPSFESFSKAEGLSVIPVLQIKIKQVFDSSHSNASPAPNCNQQLGSWKESNVNDQAFRKHVF